MDLTVPPPPLSTTTTKGDLMGATTFHVIAEGTNLDEAFKTLQDEARYEHGHGGYTGTVAEKNSVVLIDTVGSEQEAFNLADKLIEDEDPRIDDKWGPAGAIKVADDSNQRWLVFGWASE